MTVLTRKLVRDDIASSLTAAITGPGKPAQAVYPYIPDALHGESPVVLVLSRGIQRRQAGLGTQTYQNTIDLELQILVYDGAENNPLTAQEREDKVDEIEAQLAAWFAANQSGTFHRAAYYTPDAPTEITNVKYLDGDPYRLEIIKVRLEASDL